MDAFPVLLISMIIFLGLSIYLFSVERKITAIEKYIKKKETLGREGSE